MLDKKVTTDQCQDERKNIPSVGLVTMKTDNIRNKQTWQYDLHIEPSLQLDSSRIAVRKLIDDALAGIKSAKALRME